MSKYIDAEKLIAEIEKRMTENCELAEKADEAFGQRAVEDNDILALIDSLPQEQPEVDLEKELDRYLRGEFQQTAGGNFNNYIQVARHFYGLRNRALKKASRNVYESWMGGTMDDVRRDMVELGKVLNARKED